MKFRSTLLVFTFCTLLAAGATFPLVLADVWVKSETRTPTYQYTRGHWITGKVTSKADGTPVPDVLLHFVGVVKAGRSEYGHYGWTTTNDSGEYRIFVPHKWTGTVTPQAEGQNITVEPSSMVNGA